MRTTRRWTTVGLVGPSDVRDLQKRLHDYRAALQASIDALAQQGAPLPADNSAYSIQAWGDLVERCERYESEPESDWSPLAYLYAGGAYDRGRALIAELDRWRDELARRRAPRVPAPVPVPRSELSLAGGIGLALAAFFAMMLLRHRD
jgi:hypothetical protein